MKHWESLIDQKIREAMEQGEFDDLPGKGEPVDFAENPFENPELRMAHRMLRSAGFAPSWIEERKDIDAEFVVARSELAQAWSVLRGARTPEHERGENSRWEKAVTSFRQRTTQLNRRIAAWNLTVPAEVFHCKLISAEREVESIRAE